MNDMTKELDRQRQARINGMVSVITLAIGKAIDIREHVTGEKVTFAEGYKMAGETGQALFGLNTWTEDKDKAGAELAADCREVFKATTEWLHHKIYQ